MGRSHAETSYIDMLLTLDYLLSNTNEKHPAFATQICEYARDKYGFTYNGGVEGDTVKRQRFSSCLSFLYEINENNPGTLPFDIKKTKRNKYYVDKRYNLDEKQIIKLLSAIKNDKYISNREGDIIIDNLLTLLLDEHDYEYYEDKIEEYNLKSQKVNALTRRKISIIRKCLKENKIIPIHFKKYKKDGSYIEKLIYCLPYSVKEYKGKMYAILFDIYNHNVICDAIENLNIEEREDYDIENIDMNKLFNEKVYFYSDIEELIEKNIIPLSNRFLRVSFYFNSDNLDMIKNSFEYYFSKEIHLIEVGEGKYAVKDLNVNKESFESWLLTDPIGNGKTIILDLLDKVEPESCYRFAALHYLMKLEQYKEYIPGLEIKTDLNKREYIKHK